VATPGPVLPAVPLRAVVVLRYAETSALSSLLPEGQARGRTLMFHQAEVFVQTDSQTAALIAKRKNTRLLEAPPPVPDRRNQRAITGGLLLQKLLGYNFSVAVWVGYIALFGIAVETGVVMVVYLHEALDHRLKSGVPLRHEDIEAAVIEGAVHRLRPKLMTVCVVLASLIPILWETGVGADVMKPIAAPLVGGMITSTIHVLILVPVFFALMKERALRRGTLQPKSQEPAV